MKIARTFTIDYHLYQELRKRPNQSRIVETAVRRYLHADEDFSLSEVSTRQILASLIYRDNVPKAIKVLIADFLDVELHSFE